MKHRAAWRLSAWLLLLALLLTPALALAAPAADGSPCRRIEAAGDVNRRCVRAAADDDHLTECRRLWGTDDWTRRCAHAAAAADLVQVCRRIVNAGEWTRRCLPVFPGGPGEQ